MRIALPDLLSTAMARQHLDLFAMWFAGGGVTQIFRMPRGRKQRFRILRGLREKRANVDYVHMEVALVGASWVVVAGGQTGRGLHSFEVFVEYRVALRSG
eukprot:scaffold103217_cov56-Phaeocystis_antarctica.AAC.1